MLDRVQLDPGGACVIFAELPVFTQPTGLDDKLYGNVGQSAVSSFPGYTLDFPTMTFRAATAPANSGSCAVRG
jgi:hypothetical protein